MSKMYVPLTNEKGNISSNARNDITSRVGKTVAKLCSVIELEPYDTKKPQKLAMWVGVDERTNKDVYVTCEFKVQLDNPKNTPTKIRTSKPKPKTETPTFVLGFESALEELTQNTENQEIEEIEEIEED